MEKENLHFLLDMDGVLTDFLSGALEALNRDYGRGVTIEQYAKEFGKWGTYDYYGITQEEFWGSIYSTPDFWLHLKPLPWYKELYELLSESGEVTIVTSPSMDPNCAKEKLQWLHKHLGINASQVFIGSRKYLMAGNGLLIDDYHKNVDSFQAAGGTAILIPSNWNTLDLTFEKIKETMFSPFGPMLSYATKKLVA